jgi:hypothetical protein
MNTYAIRRERAWESPEELGKTAERSKEVAASDFPDDIAWIRSYVIKEEGGTLGTICIYQATDIDAVRECGSTRSGWTCPPTRSWRSRTP